MIYSSRRSFFPLDFLIRPINNFTDLKHCSPTLTLTVCKHTSVVFTNLSWLLVALAIEFKIASIHSGQLFFLSLPAQSVRYAILLPCLKTHQICCRIPVLHLCLCCSFMVEWHPLSTPIWIWSWYGSNASVVPSPSQLLPFQFVLTKLEEYKGGWGLFCS